MAQPTAFVFPDNQAALAVSRELGTAGVPVVVLSSDKGPAAHSRYSRFVETPDPYRDATAWVSSLCEQAAAQTTAPVLFATEDATLLLCDRHYQRLAEFCIFPHAAPGPASALLDKRKLYDCARAIGLGTPECAYIAAAADLDGLDCADDWIAKPACRYWIDEAGQVRTFLSLTGGNKAMAGDPRSDAARVLAAGFPVILQERVAGAFEELVSVGLCLDRGGKILSSFTARKRCEYPEPFGDGLVVETIADPGIVEPARRLLVEMGYWGMCDVEFKRDPHDGRYKLLDANPRAWLWLGLGQANGAPLARMAYRLVGGCAAVGSPPKWAGDHPIWVSPRGTAAFLTTQYRPARHGWSLPLRLTAGALGTILRNLRTFQDPLYLQPSAWYGLLAAVGRRLRAKAAGRSFEGKLRKHG